MFEQKVTIAQNGTTSGVITQVDAVIGAFTVSDWTAGTITIQGAADPAGPFNPLYDEANTQAVIAAATIAKDKGISLAVFRDIIAPWPYLKFVSSVQQAALRTIMVVGK